MLLSDFHATDLTDEDLVNNVFCGILLFSKDTSKDVGPPQVTLSTDTVQTIQHSQQVLLTQLRPELVFGKISNLSLNSCGANV